MIFQHQDVEQFFERVMALKVGGLTDEDRPVFALMDAWGWFRLSDGDQTAKIQEIISHLLSPAMRPALRRWYHRHGDKMNPPAMEFREHLSQLARERFG
jgi:hypothetical protein